ncbi:hypothetical protein VB776_22310 [Arcicella sp. DC2W]|uniref:Uncharacterized protein n=1 Tax=Arcicella gelida TaxID=2984195 RepID=A0ABU5SB40_9BACT|nr:hypothetical protein [Arcicella sp. DC2W]MEA5405689.1 hypothetical protein [Arcicella sp. DC2W]
MQTESESVSTSIDSTSLELSSYPLKQQKTKRKPFHEFNLVRKAM